METNNIEMAIFMEFAKEIMRRTFADQSPGELAAWIAQQATRLAQTSQDTSKAVLLWKDSLDAHDALMERLAQEALMHPNQRTSLDWCWDSWNRLIDPLEPGMLATLFAGDGQGKTIACECLAEHWALRGKRVVFFHYELNRNIVLMRRASRYSSLTLRELRSVRSEEQNARLARVRPLLDKALGGITYIHSPGWSMTQTVAEINRLKAAGLCDVVVTDYIEKVAPDARQIKLFGNSQNQREADNVEQLKNCIEALGVPCLMLAQSNKAGKGKADISMMGREDMRGAGEKSEKANIVIKLIREKSPDGEKGFDGEYVIQPNGYSRETTILVDKQTLGATGSFQMFMEPQYFRLTDLDRYELN